MNSTPSQLTPDLIANTPPDRETCRRARLARDTRFDGEFFLAVRTTGIYCRPICPARPPAEKNVSYFRTAAVPDSIAGAGSAPGVWVSIAAI